MPEPSPIPRSPRAAVHERRWLPPVGLLVGVLLGVLAPAAFVNRRLEPDGLLRLPPLLMVATLVVVGLCLAAALSHLLRRRAARGSPDRSLGEDLALCLVFLFTTLAWAWHFNSPAATFNNSIFGSEYGFIAEALVRGDGFADVFDTGGGATAWMPPVFVWILAAVFWLFGVKTAAALWAMIVLKALGLALALLLLLRTYSGPLQSRRWIPGVLFFVLTGMFPQFFLVMHDVWLILLLAVAMLHAFARLEAGRGGVVPLMVVLSFAVPLTSPALGLAFVVVWAVVLLRKALAGSGGLRRRVLGLVRTRELAAALVSGIVFTLAVGGWTVRNARAVGTFAPIKCNFWFDFYQANAVDDDGCISASVFFRFHPLFGNATREAYQELGEARFLASYEDRSREFLAREPGEYVRKIGCRVVNAFLYTRHEVDLAGVGDELGARDLERLREANLVGCNPHPARGALPVDGAAVRRGSLRERARRRGARASRISPCRAGSGRSAATSGASCTRTAWRVRWWCRCCPRSRSCSAC